MLIIDTSRLQLKFPCADDLPALTATWGDELTAKFMGDFGPRTPPEVSAWLATVAGPGDPPDQSGSMNLVISRRDDGAVVGWIGLGNDDRGSGHWDFGYITHPDHRGHGYATEALTGALGYCLDTMQITAVWGQCDPANLASAAVMTRAGMREIEATTSHRRFQISRHPHP